MRSYAVSDREQKQQKQRGLQVAGEFDSELTDGHAGEECCRHISEIEPFYLDRPDDETDPECQKHGKLRKGPQRFYKPIDHLILQGVCYLRCRLLGN